MNVIPTPQKDKNGGADYKLQVKQRSEREADRKDKKKDVDKELEEYSWKRAHHASRSLNRRTKRSIQKKKGKDEKNEGKDINSSQKNSNFRFSSASNRGRTQRFIFLYTHRWRRLQWNTTSTHTLQFFWVQPTLLNSRLNPPCILLHILPIQLGGLCIRRTIRVRIM